MTDLEIVQDQLELALAEIKEMNTSKTELLHDYVFEAHRLVKNLNLHFVINLVCKCENSSWNRDAGCMVCDNCGEVI